LFYNQNQEKITLAHNLAFCTYTPKHPPTHTTATTTTTKKKTRKKRNKSKRKERERERGIYLTKPA